MRAFMTLGQSRHTGLGLALVLTLAASFSAGACSKQDEAEAKAANAPTPAVEVGRENIISVTEQEIATGPLISGTLTAENEATVKAEVTGSVLQVTAEVGHAVVVDAHAAGEPTEADLLLARAGPRRGRCPPPRPARIVE